MTDTTTSQTIQPFVLGLPLTQQYTKLVHQSAHNNDVVVLYQLVGKKLGRSPRQVKNFISEYRQGAFSASCVSSTEKIFSTVLLIKAHQHSKYAQNICQSLVGIGYHHKGGSIKQRTLQLDRVLRLCDDVKNVKMK